MNFGRDGRDKREFDRRSKRELGLSKVYNELDVLVFGPLCLTTGTPSGRRLSIS